MLSFVASLLRCFVRSPTDERTNERTNEPNEGQKVQSQSVSQRESCDKQIAKSLPSSQRWRTVAPFLRWFVRSLFARSLVGWLLGWLGRFLGSLLGSLVRWFVRWFVGSLVRGRRPMNVVERSFVCGCVCVCVRVRGWRGARKRSWMLT